MKTKNKPALIALIVCIVLMFLLILPTVLLTGGKEMHDFSKSDWTVFYVFVALEIITCIAMFTFAVIVGKSNQRKPEPVAQTNRSKNLSLRGWGIFIVAFCLSTVLYCTASIFEALLPQAILVHAIPIYIVFVFLPPVLFLLNELFGNVYFRQFKNKSVREAQEFLLSHRENAGKTAQEKLSLLKKLRIANDLYVILLAIIATGNCIFGNIVWESGSYLIIGYGFFLFLCVVSRIRFSTPQKVYDDVSSLISKEEFPQLYETAEKAAKACGCTGDIKLFLNDTGFAGIRSENGYYCVLLGIEYLSMLSRQELYCILLHEFRHATYEEQNNVQQVQYFHWLNEGGNPHYMSGFTCRLFAFGDALYTLNYMLYDYASSIFIETEADRAMAQLGDAAAAASALIKLKYLDLYSWEFGTEDFESIYIPAEADQKYMTHRLQRINDVIGRRREAWNKLIDVEILARGASHPTLQMRLQTLGVQTHQVITPCTDDAFAQDIQNAISRIDAQVYESWTERYAESREEEYIKPLQIVEKWEAEGCPLHVEQYADVMDALQQLGQNKKALELCRRVVDELSGPAAVHAHYMLGCYLLHSYDEAGLEHIYHAMENNPNYIEEGLEIIGDFCCLTGNREELDCYREKALDIAQKDKDLYSHIDSLNKTDDLRTEQLPEGMLESILAYIRSIDEDAISHIYLVRKVISPDFFTSAFVIRFKIGTADEAQDEIMHKIFRHLDTCSDWQFSLFTYTNVISARVDQIEGSCVYQCE